MSANPSRTKPAQSEASTGIRQIGRAVRAPGIPSELPGAAPPGGVESRGFKVRLEGTQLADLIQLQCSCPGRSKVEIRANNTLGRLFFEDCRVVHATYGDLLGMEAVVEMLRLPSGRVYPASCQWPMLESLAHGPEQLLLQAAQQLDEAAEGRPVSKDPITGVVPRVRVRAVETELHLVNDEPERAPAALERHAVDKALGRLGDVQRVHLSLSGSMQQLSSGATAELSDLTFFVQQAADRMGAQLGLGPCRAVMGAGEERSLVVFRDTSLTGVFAPSEAVVELGRALGVE